MRGAETVIVAMGSLAMESLEAAAVLRNEGRSVGVLGLRVFRPFPGQALTQALRGVRHIVVFDKNISYGLEGAVCTEIKAALYGSGSTASVKDFIVGLGGRDVSAHDLADAVRRSTDTDMPPDSPPEWLSKM